MRQFATLVWKEWRQLRGVRWTSVLLALVVLAVLLASTLAGETGERNALGFRTPDSKQIAADVGPIVFASLLWPLIALLSVVQAFTGDRASRCHQFLALQPVSRAKVWSARALSSSVSFAASVALSCLPLVGLLLLTAGGPGTERAWSALGVGMAAQLLVLPLVLAGGSAAAALGLSGFAALGLSVALGLLVLATAVWLPSALVFMRASLSPWYGAAFGLPPVLGLAGSALWATVRGEPLGSDGWKRALPAVLASVIAPPMAYVALSPMLFEWSERRGVNHTFVAPAEGRLAVEIGEGAFVVDTGALERTAYVPPYVWWAGIGVSPRGDRVAIARESLWMGLFATASSVLIVYDAEGQRLHEFGPQELGCQPFTPFWVEDELFTNCSRDDEYELLRVDLPSGETRVISQQGEGLWSFVGIDAEGRRLLRVLGGSGPGERANRIVEYDPAAGTLATESLIDGITWSSRDSRLALSPSGRFYRIDSETVMDLGSRIHVELPPAPEGSRARWNGFLDGDRVLRTWTVENGDRLTTLELVDVAAGSVEELGTWSGKMLFRALPAPDGRHALVTVSRFREGEPRGWHREQTLLLNAASLELRPLRHEFVDWAGTDVLAVRVEGRLGLWRLGDAPDAVKPLR